MDSRTTQRVNQPHLTNAFPMHGKQQPRRQIEADVVEAGLVIEASLKTPFGCYLGDLSHCAHVEDDVSTVIVLKA